MMRKYPNRKQTHGVPYQGIQVARAQLHYPLREIFMDFSYSERTEELRARVRNFLGDHILPGTGQ